MTPRRLMDRLRVPQRLDAALKARCGLSAFEFFDLLAKVDDELLSSGVEVRNRPIHAMTPMSLKLGIPISMLDSDPIAASVQMYYKFLYGDENLAVGPLHVGVLMIRDVFYEVFVPITFGSVRINPWDHVQAANRDQLDVLCYLNEEDVNICQDQLIDLFDFGFSLLDARSASVKVDDTFLFLAKEQMEGACRTLHGSFSKRVAIQGTAYAVEMAGKAILSGFGVGKKELSTKYGHHLDRIFSAVSDHVPTFSYASVERSIARIPYVILERYNLEDTSRLKIGEIIRHGQFVLGEVGRTISNRNMRAAFEPQPARVFP